MRRACRSSSWAMSSGVATADSGTVQLSGAVKEPPMEPVLPSHAAPRLLSRASSNVLSLSKRSRRRRSSPVHLWSWKHSIMAAALHRRSWASLSTSPRPATSIAEAASPLLIFVGCSAATARGTARSAAERIPSMPTERSPKPAFRSMSAGWFFVEDSKLLHVRGTRSPARSCSNSCRLSRSAACAASAKAASEQLRASAWAARASARHCSRPDWYWALASENIVLMAVALAAATDMPASRPGNCASSSRLCRRANLLASASVCSSRACSASARALAATESSCCMLCAATRRLS
mmetsp:Transcript_51110/g.141560  ORF Transcript_51110/g.141560 Transcript_51110/m.141560 type:complete len:294 (-) Transcript_51110:360-1241(-)